MADTFSDGMDPILTLLDERPSEEWEWSFEPDATDRSAVNALALGNAALLAYSDCGTTFSIFSGSGSYPTHAF